MGAVFFSPPPSGWPAGAGVLMAGVPLGALFLALGLGLRLGVIGEGLVVSLQHLRRPTDFLSLVGLVFVGFPSLLYSLTGRFKRARASPRG